MLACKIHCGNDVRGVARGNGICAWTRNPSVDPAEIFGERDIIADRVRVFEQLEDIRASMQTASGDRTLMSSPPTSRSSSAQRSPDGHAASPGRARENGRTACAAALVVTAGISAAALPRNSRLFIPSLVWSSRILS
jgi:hypothetical protein